MSAVVATATARAQLRCKVEAFLASNVVGDAGAHAMALEQIADMASGTGAGNCDLVWYGDRTLAGSATENHDLIGSLIDALGNDISFAKVKLLVVKNTSPADGTDLSVGPVTAGLGFGIGGFWNAAADKSIVPAGGCLYLYDPNGVAAAAGASDLLTCIARAAVTTTYKILIVGTSV